MPIRQSRLISQRAAPALAIALSALTLAVAGAADALLPSAVWLPLLYALPVLLLSWYFGVWAAVAAVAAANALWLALAIVDGTVAPAALAVDLAGQIVLLAVCAALVLRLRLLIRQSHEAARRDTLTGLPNSRSFYETAEIEVMRARRYGHPISLAFIDLDDFKQVNDRFGHPIGDMLLAEFAKLAFATLRRTDTLARIGGDEFVVLMPETDQAAAKAPIEKLRANMEAVMRHHDWPVTLSVGVFTFLTIPDSLQVMITFADSLMYSVKLNGKNRVAYEVFANDKAEEIEG